MNHRQFLYKTDLLTRLPVPQEILKIGIIEGLAWLTKARWEFLSRRFLKVKIPSQIKAKQSQLDATGLGNFYSFDEANKWNSWKIQNMKREYINENLGINVLRLDRILSTVIFPTYC